MLHVMPLELVKEVLAPSGGKWGGTHIDDQYVELLEKIFGKEV